MKKDVHVDIRWREIVHMTAFAWKKRLGEKSKRLFKSLKNEIISLFFIHAKEKENGSVCPEDGKKSGKKSASA